MSEAANSSIPLEIRQQFPCDDRGRVLWFTTPPLNHTVAPLEAVSHKDGKPLAHTPEYMAAKEKRRTLIEERKKAAREKIPDENNTAKTNQQTDSDAQPSPKRKKINDTLLLQTLTDQILNARKAWSASQHSDDRAAAAGFEAYDTLRAVERRKEFENKKAYFEEKRRVEVERRERERAMEGRVFRDDWMERL
jgi:chromatin structure-remodeling complex subunit RSC1/2